MIGITSSNKIETFSSKESSELKASQPEESTKLETLESEKQKINIYESHLKANSPTYSEEIKDIMKKENIKESHLNAKVIESMEESGLDITKESLNIIVSELQEEHLFKLFNEGYDLETLTIDVIARVIKEGKVILKQKASLSNKNDELIAQYKDKIEAVMEDDDTVLSNMVRHQSQITINNLYAAKYRGNPKKTDESLTREQIIAVLSMNGIKVTQANINAASALSSGCVEITRENIKNAVTIQRAVSGINPDELVKIAVKETREGKLLGNNPLNGEVNNEINYLEPSKIEQIVDNIQEIDEVIIEATYDKGKPVTLENLQKTLYENIGKALKGNDDSEKTQMDTNANKIDIEKVVDTKRQIEEIRLRLTLEAALKLNSKLNIETSELSKIVEELKAMEREKNAAILSNVGAPVTDENIEIMQETNEKLYNISRNKEIATSKVVQEETDFTIEGMDKAIKLKNAQNTYEETGSKPEGRFGEGIARVEEQIGHILDLNQIESTPTNIKAAKALIENNIDITKENVEMAKVVLLKIETILYELKPAVVANMLKDGLRPDTMPVDQLIDYIREVHENKNIDLKQNIAHGILELDQKDQLNPKEREGLIAVYRMLSTITKNETAAIGFLLSHDKEPTLGNLFEASKYIKKVGSKTGKMDVTINDELGPNEGELPTNIRSLISEAIKGSEVGQGEDKWLNTKHLIDQWLARVTPDQLKSYLDMDKPLEELELQGGKLPNFELDQVSEQAKDLEKLSPHTLTFLKKHNMPLTIPNIYWTDKIIKNPYLLGDMLKDYEDLTGEKIDTLINNSSKESIDELLEGLEKELDEQKPSWLSTSQSAKAYNMGKEVEQMLSTQKQISQNEGMYQVPVALHHGMSNLNIYVMKDKESSSKAEKDELRAYMSIKTKNLGVIQVNMRISDKALDFEMIGETPGITLGLQDGSNGLKATIEEIGYSVRQAKFTHSKTKSSLIDSPKASSDLLKYKFNESKFEHII